MKTINNYILEKLTLNKQTRLCTAVDVVIGELDDIMNISKDYPYAVELIKKWFKKNKVNKAEVLKTDPEEFLTLLRKHKLSAEDCYTELGLNMFSGNDAINLQYFPNVNAEYYWIIKK